MAAVRIRPTDPKNPAVGPPDKKGAAVKSTEKCCFWANIMPKLWLIEADMVLDVPLWYSYPAL